MLSGITLWFLVMTVIPAVILVQNPGRADVWTFLGALLASFLAVQEARLKNRSFTYLFSVFIGCMVVGSTVPGIFHDFAMWRQWISEDTDNFVSWKVWLLSGFFCAANGWGFIYGVRHFWQKWQGKYLGRGDPPAPPVNPKM